MEKNHQNYIALIKKRIGSYKKVVNQRMRDFMNIENRIVRKMFNRRYKQQKDLNSRLK